MYFLDTNILVYSIDPDEPRKHAIAKKLHREALSSDNGAISSQVVQELCAVALRKFKTRLTLEDLAAVIQEGLLPILRHRPGSGDFYVRALRLYEQRGLGFYDALIVQAALDLGCKTLYSEDLQDGRRYGGLVIKNPFK